MHDLLGQQGCAGGSAKRSPSRKSRLPMLHVDAARRRSRRRAPQRDSVGQRLAQLVVADPGVEQVAEHVERRRIARRTARRTHRTPRPAPAASATGGGRRRTASALSDFGARRARSRRPRSARSGGPPLLAGRNALDLVDDVLARDHAAEHAVAPALRVGPLWSRKSLSATLMKNCAVAECGSDVRAIATV